MRHITGRVVHIHPTAKISPTAHITGDQIIIGEHSTIEDGAQIFCPEGITLGPCSYIGQGVHIACLRFTAAQGYLYMERGAEVGRGGCLGSPDSTVAIGRGSFFGADSIVNPAHAVTIGDEVGVAGQIWTHGAWPDVLQGAPEAFGPVSIGDHTWLPRNSVVLPGLSVGSDVVISMLTLVNRSIPDGALVGGVPVKIIKEHQYPRQVQQAEILGRLLETYEQLAAWKGIHNFSLQIDASDNILLKSGEGIYSPVYIFDMVTKVIRNETIEDSSDLPAVVEDLRDFLRRHGIRFFTGRPFKPMLHPDTERWARLRDVIS